MKLKNGPFLYYRIWLYTIAGAVIILSQVKVNPVFVLQVYWFYSDLRETASSKEAIPQE